MTAERLRARLAWHVAGISDVEALRRLVAIAADADPGSALELSPESKEDLGAVEAPATALDRTGEAGEGRRLPLS